MQFTLSSTHCLVHSLFIECSPESVHCVAIRDGRSGVYAQSFLVHSFIPAAVVNISVPIVTYSTFVTSSVSVEPHEGSF